VIMVPTAATSEVMAPTFAAVRNAAVVSAASAPAAGRRSRCHTAMPVTRPPATRKQAAIVCGNVPSCSGFVITARKLVSSSRCVIGL